MPGRAPFDLDTMSEHFVKRRCLKRRGRRLCAAATGA